MEKIEPIPWRGFSFLDKLIVVTVPLAAVTIMALPFLDEAFLRRVARMVGARSFLAWLVNDNGAIITGLALLLFLVVFLLWKRQRLVSDKRLWYGTGCPNCKERELVRVSRHGSDRLYGLIAVPAYRFACRHCIWRGLRIARREWTPELEAAMESSLARFDLSAPQPPNATQSDDIEPVPAREGLELEDTDDLTESVVDPGVESPDVTWEQATAATPEPVGNLENDVDAPRLI